MHASSFENMLKCYWRYVVGNPDLRDRSLRVIDIGGADVNGSYSEIFSGPGFEYNGADLVAGPGVSIVLDDPYQVPCEDTSFDLVLSGQMLEHSEYFWLAFAEMVRLVKPDGFIFLIAPSAGPIHQYPVDCYRFYPDSYKALAKLTGCHLVDCWHDQRGPWNDLVGVFSKTPRAKVSQTAPDVGAVAPINQFAGDADSDLDLVKGGAPYLRVLERLHTVIKPKNYLEIGVRHGRSLALSRGQAVGVDPDPDLKVPLPPSAEIVQQESDVFFELGSHPVLKAKPELIFIDGMHLFENVLRDFMHAERIASSGAVIVIDDVLPNLPEQATRERNTRVWTGDVWKIHACLEKYRPDLQLVLLDTAPSGLLIITGLDSKSRILWNRYNPIVREYSQSDEGPPPHVLDRQQAISPTGQAFDDFMRVLAETRQADSKFRWRKHDVKPGYEASHAARSKVSNRPRLSIVVVAYNMARELPRTLRSLTPPMQRDIDVADYEIIVVDNGSTRPFDRDACQAISPNIRFVFEPPGDPSPVKAINRAIHAARGELVGVCIDGARMASPGLLAKALQAEATSDCPVIGTIAFHLGGEVQTKAAQKGYNQEVEDELLKTVPWEKDGYRLFDIAALAGSSSRGWYSWPTETNALFMKKATWQEIGGFDESFQCPGGGLANLDVWTRACHHPKADVIMLLGDATFHQFHGGVATNAQVSRWDEFDSEYKAIRGEKFKRRAVPFRLIGEFLKVHGKSIAASAPPGS
ncbi:glycosyltransferase [Hyphomonas johnsonii]|uniref:Type 11 methyltransferase n=1 Tax=Hyphomonas johnsonii MHS-2 TaxID=1280950 RepID=A0A059FBN7_9PROT|nr:glycosyltransferase [Hyphomonas johnsonii]KCZ87958.1 type 11 methyltransferase [Hyphomonas johnsonii MHS-2]